MTKEKVLLEYPLGKVSENYLWRMIGDPMGLATWFSEEITVEENEFTFSWDDQEQVAFLLKKEDGRYVKFQWEDEQGTDNYFKIEILTQDLTGSVILQITDFVEPDNKDDSKLLWDRQIEDLKRKCGM